MYLLNNKSIQYSVTPTHRHAMHVTSNASVCNDVTLNLK